MGLLGKQRPSLKSTSHACEPSSVCLELLAILTLKDGLMEGLDSNEKVVGAEEGSHPWAVFFRQAFPTLAEAEASKRSTNSEREHPINKQLMLVRSLFPLPNSLY